MNEEHHWNSIAKKYNEEIFDVFASDQKKLIPAYLKKHSDHTSTALDFGCGNGKAFPLLSPMFKSVIGIDISQELLNQAKSREYPNVQLLQRDLSKPGIKIPKADFTFSCNVVMLPEVEKNYAMLRNVYRSLRPGGTALLIIPSTESLFHSAWRMIDWYKREGVSPEAIDNSEFSYFKGSKLEILQGIFYIDQVPTKHYTEPELEVILKKAKLRPTAIEKLEYSWKTEFDSPPAWMKEPYPWDWLIECSKTE